jgi:hypothetical protein
VLLLIALLLNLATRARADSTAYLDLGQLFSDAHWQELYQNPVLLEMLRTRIGQVADAAEQQQLAQWIEGFVARGFASNDNSRFRLFRPEHAQLRKDYFDIVQRSPYKLGSPFLQRTYAGFRDRPGERDFSALTEDAWAEFAAQVGDDASFESLIKSLGSEGVSADWPRYLQLLFHGYCAYPAHEKGLDDETRRLHLDAKTLTGAGIQNLYEALQQGSYWSRFENKRGWMRSKAAWRLFNDFSPQQWASLSPDTVLGLAGALKASSETPEFKPVPLEDWLRKTCESIKREPQQQSVRTLLGQMLMRSGVPLDDSFRMLREQFESDQPLFVALHAKPPDPAPMQIWHADARNLQQSVDMLKAFFAPGRAAAWDLPLWDCLQTWYYKPHAELRDPLFDGIMKPMVENADLAANAVRRRLLSDTHRDGSYLTDPHRYEIAHQLLAAHPMTDPAGSDDAGLELLQFVVDVYGSLQYKQPELYTAPSLKSRLRKLGLSNPRTEPERMICYVNAVIGEPLVLLCHALMGRTQDTRGVAFEWQENRIRQLDALLLRVLQLKNSLRDDYDTRLDRIVVLEEVLDDMVRELQSAIQKGDRQRIVQLVKLTLKVTIVIEDDAYLERVLKTLRTDVFGVPEDPAEYRQLAQEDVRAKVKLFQELHSEELIQAIRLFGKMKYLEMFYDELYVPLRSIHGFFREAGAEPYRLFLEEFTAKGYDAAPNLEERYRKEIASLGAIHDAGNPSGTRYINAESAVTDLLGEYCRKLSLDLWKTPDRVPLNRNVGLGVLYRLLVEKQTAGWKMGELQGADRAKCYRQTAELFLAAFDHPEWMDRPVNWSESPAVYDRWHFFSFVRSMLELYEIHGFPFPERDPASLYDGSPQQGVNRKQLVAAQDVSVRQVDGTLRAQVCESYRDVPQVQGVENFANQQQLLALLLLLPNCPENAAGGQAAIDAYFQLKARDFAAIVDLLDSAAQLPDAILPEDFWRTKEEKPQTQDMESAKRRVLMAWLCRLEESVFGLGDETKGFGYEKMRDEWFEKLQPLDRYLLAFEEFRLRRVNQALGTGDSAAGSIVQMAEMVDQLMESICQAYVFPRASQKLDSAAKAILDLYRRHEPTQMLEVLKKEHVQEFWFLTTQCAEMLRVAAQKGQQLSAAEKDAAISVSASLLFLHSYFMPYAQGSFKADILFNDQAKSALPLFCMLNRDVKRPIVQLLVQHAQTWDESIARAPNTASLSPLRLEQLRTFLICHNFLPLQLLEASLDDFARFRRLILGEAVELTTYNFRLLWERKDQARVSLETLCEEVFDGVDCNRELLSRTGSMGDDEYLQYFFGDMRRIFDGDVKFSEQMPRNFDTVVRKLAELGQDKRLMSLRKQLGDLKQQLAASADGAQRGDLQRLEVVERGLDTLPDKIKEILSQGYEYVGRVIAERFQSVFSMQKACEMAAARVDKAAPPAVAAEAYELYLQFYVSSLFGASGFRPELELGMVQRFYSEPQSGQASAAYRQDRRNQLLQLIDGRKDAGTQGLAVTAKKNSAARNPFEKAYMEAGLGLLQSLFCGRRLPTNRPFIGDVVWEIGEDGASHGRPLDYDHRAEDIEALLLWVYEAANRYRDFPEILGVFVPPGMPIPKAGPSPNGSGPVEVGNSKRKAT